MESKKVHYFKPKMVIDRTKTNDTTAKKQTTIEDSVSNYDTKRTFVDVVVKDGENSIPPVKYKVVNPPKPDKPHPSKIGNTLRSVAGRSASAAVAFSSPFTCFKRPKKATAIATRRNAWALPHASER